MAEELPATTRFSPPTDTNTPDHYALFRTLQQTGDYSSLIGNETAVAQLIIEALAGGADLEQRYTNTYDRLSLALMDAHEKGERVIELMQQVNNLTQEVTAFKFAIQYGNGTGHHRSAEHPDPDPFDGDAMRLPHFLREMAFKLRANGDWYPTEDSKLIYFISRLKGKAFGQVQGRIDQDGNINFTNVAEVVAILQVAFGELDEKASAQEKLLELKQGHRPFAVFVAEWQEFVLKSKFDNEALMTLLKKAVHPALLTRYSFLPKNDVPTTHDTMVTCFRNLDAQVRMADSSYHKKGNGNSNAPNNNRSTPVPAYNPPITSANDDAMDLSLLNIAGNVVWTAQDVANARRPQNPAEQAARKLYNTKHGLCHWCSSDKHKAPACAEAPWNKGGEEKKTVQGKA